MGRRYVDWWAKYNEYMRSEKWFEKRERILKRDKGKCVLCNKDATQVHHNTYERFGGKERLSDLVSLCKDCHERYHCKTARITTKTKEIVFSEDILGEAGRYSPQEVYEALFYVQNGRLQSEAPKQGIGYIKSIRESLPE